MSRLNQTQIVLIGGIAAAATLSLLYYFVFSRRELADAKKVDSELEDIAGSTTTDTKKDTASRTTSSSSAASVPASPEPTPRGSAASAEKDKTPLVKNTKKDEKEIHAKIEELDKRGKALFKDKQVRYCPRRLVVVPQSLWRHVVFDSDIIFLTPFVRTDCSTLFLF